ncbi:hypothetical protein J4218_01510 [Candidatus Pacearchaeota archaeon]|nr:hypothetical protein [Candidatus Pacearchaeota archaeon]
MKNKKSQITIFIIFALIIVVLILIFIFWRFQDNPIVQIFDERNPQGSIETCTRMAVEDAIARISNSGADISPGYSVQFMNDEIVYICYSGENYKPCAYQRPLLVEHIQREITEYITPKIADCFEKLRFKLKESSTDVIDTPGIKVTTNIYPKHVEIRIQKDFQIIREDRTINFNNFKINMLHPIYDFADIAMEAANQQAKYCYFDSLGYMIINPSFDINETITGRSDRIYVLTERATEHRYQFALRSCPLPPGY